MPGAGVADDQGRADGQKSGEPKPAGGVPLAQTVNDEGVIEDAREGEDVGGLVAVGEPAAVLFLLEPGTWKLKV